MTHLDTNQRRGIAALLRGHARLHRELAAAKALLSLCEQQKLYPQGWKQSLEKMKETPAYGKIAQELDTIASLLEQSADEIDLTELLQKLPKQSPAN